MIDMRLRPPLPSWKNSRIFSPATFAAFDHPDYPKPRSCETLALADLITEMDETGIETGVAMGRQTPTAFGIMPNEELADFAKANSDRFVAWAALDLTQDMDKILADFNHAVALYDFKGISIEPTLLDKYSHAGDKRLYPLYEVVQKSRLPINISLSCALQAACMQEIDKARPGHMLLATKDFPELNFHIAHAAWPYTREAVALAISRKNVWLSPDMYFVPQFPGAEDYFTAAKNYLGDRILFGSSYPFKPLKASVDNFRSWGFSKTQFDAITSENAKRLMRL
ncbi:amidohydrolase family protein [Advenella sp. FME57]|uniref:amidohydrolase family protein n=1 Tax=Advenella sp. FME57 TaxID=2742604 RepID=UPI0018670049|nr:amidohydrolase family protein [Advenella sp. FME57]